MNSVKILHIADAHLDAPFSSLSPMEAELARRSLRSAFAAALFTAKNRGVQLVLIAGDLFDGAYITPDTRDFICDKLAEYEGIRFFIAPGNHDPYSEGSPYRNMSFPDNVHIFGEKSAVVIEELGVAVYSAPFTSAEERVSPLADLPSLNGELINILVCHGDLGAPTSPYGPISLAEIGNSGFDYIALGHIHKCSGVLTEKGVHYAYSGCIEGRGFDEAGDKGALIGTVSKGKAELSFLPLARRKYAIESVDISDATSRSEVVELIRGAMRPYGSDTHLRIVLTGSPCELFTVNEATFETGGSNPVSIEIKDKSVPTVRLTEAEEQNTLRGVFLRRMRSRLESLPKDSEEYAECAEAMRLGLAALSGRDLTGV